MCMKFFSTFNYIYEVLSRLGLTTIGDCRCLHVLCANAKKQRQSGASATSSAEKSHAFANSSCSCCRGREGTGTCLKTNLTSS